MNKRTLLFVVLLLSIRLVLAQEDKKGLKFVSFSAGPSFSNFSNSEAPHKINIYGSDKYPAILPLDVSESESYFDYKTDLLKDIKVGLSVGIGFEYFVKNDLSLYFSITYEEKGINLRDDKHESSIYVFEPYPPVPPPATNILYYDENYDIKISNNYLTMPVLIRKYINQTGLYVQGGFYISNLLRSQIYTYNRKHEYFPDYAFYGYDSWFKINNEIDKKKEFTMNIDFGISFGTGFSHALTDRLLLTTNLILNLGLHKIDKKYNNEYFEHLVPSYVGLDNYVRSTNYFGLNSNAKNISSSISVGLVYKLKK
jgi:hypothetical protein